MTLGTFVWRNLGRNRFRTILTALAVAFSTFLVCAVLTLPSVRDGMLSSTAGSLRLATSHKAGLSYWLPLAHAQRVRALPHVVSVNHWTWFGGIYTDPTEQFPNYAIDPETVAGTWPDFDWDAQTLETFKQMRNGALVGVRTMEQFDWKVGDEITLRDSVFDLDLSFKIIGQIPASPDEPLAVAFWFSRTYLEESAPNGFEHVSTLWTQVDEPQHLNTVKAAIDGLFRNSSAQTETQTEFSMFASFLSSFDGLIAVVMLIGLLVVVAIALIVANTAAISMRERAADVAVLKTLGFRRRTIFLLLLGESSLVASLGGGVGAGLAYLVLNAGSSSWAPFLGPLSLFIMPVSVVVIGLVLALTTSLLAGIIPVFNATRLNVVTALRQIT